MDRNLFGVLFAPQDILHLGFTTRMCITRHGPGQDKKCLKCYFKYKCIFLIPECVTNTLLNWLTVYNIVDKKYRLQVQKITRIDYLPEEKIHIKALTKAIRERLDE